MGVLKATTRKRKVLSQSPEDDTEFLFTVSQMYYIEGKTQREIADYFGISRPLVSQLLAAARAQGLVRVTVVDPATRFKGLEDEMSSCFSLRRCKVTPSVPDAERVRMRVAYAAACLFEDLIQNGDVIGVGPGRSVSATVDLLNELRHATGLKVVPLAGGTPHVAGSRQVNEVARDLAAKIHGECFLLNAPLYVDDPSIARLLMTDPSIARSTELWDRISCALVGIGALDAEDPYFMARVRASESQEIVADFCGRFFTRDGQEAGGKFVVAIEPHQLRKAREVVAVAGGVSKARAIRAILRGKLITTLVTDEDTARAVLGLEDGRGAGT